MSSKLEIEGVILTNNENGELQIQRIDDAEQWMEDKELEYVKQLSSDKEAVDIVRELIIDNYIETIGQDLMQGDKSLLYSLLAGQGLKPISNLTEKELIEEAIELGIF